MTLNLDVLKRLLIPLAIAALTFLNKKLGLNLTTEELIGVSGALIAVILTGQTPATDAKVRAAAAEARAEEARGTVDTNHDAALYMAKAAQEFKEAMAIHADMVKLQLEKS